MIEADREASDDGAIAIERRAMMVRLRSRGERLKRVVLFSKHPATDQRVQENATDSDSLQLTANEQCRVVVISFLV